MRACAYVYARTHLPVPASELFWEGLMKGDGRIRGWMYATLLENPKYAPDSYVDKFLSHILCAFKGNYSTQISLIIMIEDIRKT